MSVSVRRFMLLPHQPQLQTAPCSIRAPKAATSHRRRITLTRNVEDLCEQELQSKFYGRMQDLIRSQNMLNERAMALGSLETVDARSERLLFDPTGLVKACRRVEGQEARAPGLRCSD